MGKDLAARAKRHGLLYVSVDALCFHRQKHGRGFAYRDAGGRPIRDRETLARIRALVLPPAWTEVCIADSPRAHIQAVGRDAEGRLQYRYHDDWKTLRDRVKAERLFRFGRALPKIRARIEKDLRRRDPDRRFAAAAAGRLIDVALLRAGHSGTEEGGRGATTLLRSDVRLNGTRVTLDFVGKSGKTIRKTIKDPVLLRRLRRLKRIGRKRLFVFRDAQKQRRRLHARDLNAYLRDAAGRTVTAKDFRTFAASAQALAALCAAEEPASETARKRLVASVIRDSAERLSNTPAVARSSYVHPIVMGAFESGLATPTLLQGPPRAGLDKAETALMRLLEAEAGPQRG
jgi:DNA topoisomerase-1